MKNKQPPVYPPFVPANIRCRIIPLASTAAALSFAGCSFLHGAHHASANSSPNQDAVPSSIMTPQQRAMLDVQNYTDSVNAALNNPNAPQPDATPKQSPALATAGKSAPPSSTPISSTPIATLTPLADRVSGIPTALGAMTAMSVTPQEQSASAPATEPAPATQPTAFVTPIVPSIPPPMPFAASVHIKPTFSEAMNVLRNRVAAHPTLNTTLALALLEGSEGKTPDLTLANSLSTPDQKLLTDLLAALQGMTTPISASTSLNDRAAPLVDAAKRWEADADLALPKLALASRVDSFGVYTPVEPKFTQGEHHTVILYCEVANFASSKAADGFFETRLSQQESLITEDGLLVYRPNAEDVEDRSLNQRHDFYLVKKLTIPDTLAVGKYILRMNVTDRTNNKIAIVNMPIEITSD